MNMRLNHISSIKLGYRKGRQSEMHLPESKSTLLKSTGAGLSL